MLFNKLAKQLCFLWVIGLTCLFVQCTPSPVEEIVNSTQSSLLAPTWRPTKTTLPATPTITLPITPTQVAITPFPTLPPTPTLVAPTPTDTMVVTSPTISVTFPPNAKVIVVATNFQNDDLLLYTLDNSGKLGQQLTNANSDSYGPVWSSECSQVAFSYRQNNEPAFHLSTININTGDTMFIQTPFQKNFDPNWSPAGDYLLFRGNDEEFSQIYTFSMETQIISRLTNEGDNTYPDWSPDGSQIVFISNRGDPFVDSGIYVMDSDGGNQRHLFGPESGEYTLENPGVFEPQDPQWSLAGRRILFSAVESPDVGLEYSKIYTLSIEGTDLQPVTNSSPKNPYTDPIFFERNPRWSSNGETVLFIRSSLYEPAKNNQLCLATISTGEFVCLPNETGYSFLYADWCFE